MYIYLYRLVALLYVHRTMYKYKVPCTRYIVPCTARYIVRCTYIKGSTPFALLFVPSVCVLHLLCSSASRRASSLSLYIYIEREIECGSFVLPLHHIETYIVLLCTHDVYTVPLQYNNIHEAIYTQVYFLHTCTCTMYIVLVVVMMYKFYVYVLSTSYKCYVYI